MTTARANATAAMGDGNAAAAVTIRLVPLGELDMATAPMFLDSLAAALDRRPASVEIDLGWLTFIDARSVGAIAAASTRMAAWGGGLAVCGAGPGIGRMFELCGLAHLLMPCAPETEMPHSRALPPAGEPVDRRASAPLRA